MADLCPDDPKIFAQKLDALDDATFFALTHFFLGYGADELTEQLCGYWHDFYYRTGLVVLFKWNRGALIEDRMLWPIADSFALFKMLTTIVRADRFSEGYFYGRCQDGTVPGVLTELARRKPAPQNQLTPAGLARLGIEIQAAKDGPDTFVLRHIRLVNNVLYNQKELVEMGKQILPGCKFKPIIFEFDRTTVTPEFVESQCQRFGLKPNDLVKQLGIPKARLDDIRSGRTSMDAATAALFFYYFLFWEENQSRKAST